jgi:hypothetical protein
LFTQVEWLREQLQQWQDEAEQQQLAAALQASLALDDGSSGSGSEAAGDSGMEDDVDDSLRDLPESSERVSFLRFGPEHANIVMLAASVAHAMSTNTRCCSCLHAEPALYTCSTVSRHSIDAATGTCCGLMLWVTCVGSCCGSHVWAHAVGHMCGLMLWVTCVGSCCGSQVWAHAVGHMCGLMLWVTCVGSCCGSHVWAHAVGHMCGLMLRASGRGLNEVPLHLHLIVLLCCADHFRHVVAPWVLCMCLLA